MKSTSSVSWSFYCTQRHLGLTCPLTIPRFPATLSGRGKDAEGKLPLMFWLADNWTQAVVITLDVSRGGSGPFEGTDECRSGACFDLRA